MKEGYESGSLISMSESSAKLSSRSKPKDPAYKLPSRVPTSPSAAESRRVSRSNAKAKADARHDTYVVRTYGLLPGQYGEMLAEQLGRCAICGNRPARRRLAVDHSHLSGKPRALLCLSCNHDVLGRLESNPISLLALIAYVRNILEDDFPEYLE